MYNGIVVSTLGLGLAAAGCSGSSSTGDLFAAKPQPQEWTLHVKSEPPGAEAKAPQGQTCRTPCMLMLPMADTTVTVSLDGYYPQAIPVKWLPATFHYELYERTEEPTLDYPTDFSPNPVIAQLERGPVTPPSAKQKPSTKHKKVARRTRGLQSPQGSPSPPPQAR